jgi:CBS domain containing-hemolysin-like protein
MSLASILLASFAFVVLNAVFVAAEFALIAAPRMTLERQSASGDRLARHVLRVASSARRQDRYLATAQLGITLASLGLGMFGEHALAGYLTDNVPAMAAVGGAAMATALSLCLLTVAHIVIGEMLPKGMALQNPIGVARWAHWPMYITLLVLYPFVAVLNGIANLSLRMIGVRRQQNTHEQIYTPEELQLIVEESERGGTLRGESGRLLQELFEFGDLTAAGVMVPRVRIVGIPVGATPEDVRRIVREHRRTRYPIYDGDLDQIVGMLHAKDLLRHMLRNENVVADGTRRLPVVPETAALDQVLNTMQVAQAHMALVVDEHGGTAGILSLEDLFEEVVGEIEEGQPMAPELAPAADGTVRVAGTLRLGELGAHFDLDLEHEDVQSVSGLILARLDRLPVVGDVVEYERIRLEVLSTSGRGVKEARASLLPEDKNSES